MFFPAGEGNWLKGGWGAECSFRRIRVETLWCHGSSTSLEREKERGTHCFCTAPLPPSLWCLPAPPRRGWGTGGRLWGMDGLLFFLLWAYLQFAGVKTQLQMTSAVQSGCSECGSLDPAAPSGEDLLPPSAVERGWAYLRWDDTNTLQRFLSLDSELWLVDLCHEVGAEQKILANSPALGLWLLFGGWHVFFEKNPASI